MSAAELRQCRRCELWFPEEPQHFRAIRSGGRVRLLHTCRECEREYARQWRADFPERRAESLRRYHDRYPERLAQRAHDYRLAHLAGIQAREARYRDANRARIRERQRLQKRRARSNDNNG